MNTLFYCLILPIIIYAVVRKLDAKYRIGGNRALLLAACVLFGVSIFLPSPLIHGQETQFWTHFLGGGVFMGLLWLYFRQWLKPRPWYVELAILYVATSALGVLNELYELFAHEIGWNPTPVTDTSWDLAANTLGILVFYGCFRLAKRLFFSR
jgi:hypothetical protein